MERSKKLLDEAVYGLTDTKMQIMQLLGQLISNPTATGTSIAIHGDKGVGKTSIVQDGISKILNRPFAFIPLGGATDASYLEGHSYTYEGSVCGKIVQILMDCKVMNPVIYFDELDKLSDTPKGYEIANILIHLTDTTQNFEFHDKYFSNMHFDLSKCIFIFSYNDETKINPVLRDRMYTIRANGYSKTDKIEIAKQYLTKKIAKQVNFSEDDICFTDAVLGHIIDRYCPEEAGVRSLKRCLETIYTKLNLCRLMRPGTSMFDKNITVELVLPCTLTHHVVDALLKPGQQPINKSLLMMYI
jgi:ATP-dependent Lon protease